MNISIVGYGRMGKIVESLALKEGLKVKSTIDPIAKESTHKEINESSLKDVDVCIEFSSPEVVIDNIKKISNLGVNHVLATTGWYDEIEEAKKIIEKAGTGFIYSSNFSIGVNIFFRIIENAAKIINKFDEYDIFGYELHHNRKKDSPSGTAKFIEKILLENIKRKKSVVEEKLDRRINSEEIHFASVRGGEIPGVHVVGFDSKADTIELKHTARNREGFALGSLIAAKWIKGKKGFFTMDDLMKDIILEKGGKNV